MPKFFTTSVCAVALAVGSTVAAQEPITAPGPEGELAGTLVRPDTGKPLIVIIPGSGPTDRDGNNPMGVTAASYRLLAEALAERGIGTIRIDKRGMFGSKAAIPDANAVTIDAYADDVAAWAEAGRTATGVRCVWALGHSEGGLVALAAADQAKLCGIILVAAPGRPLGAILREQLSANPANGPLMPQALDALAKLERGERVDAAALHPALRPLFANEVQGFVIDLLSRDPAAMARAAKVPLLIVQGGSDIQVSMADAEALHAARPDAEYVVLEDMNHVLKQPKDASRTANLATYADPSLPLAEGLVEGIVAFVLNDRTGS